MFDWVLSAPLQSVNRHIRICDAISLLKIKLTFVGISRLVQSLNIYEEALLRK